MIGLRWPTELLGIAQKDKCLPSERQPQRMRGIEAHRTHRKIIQRALTEVDDTAAWLEGASTRQKILPASRLNQ